MPLGLSGSMNVLLLCYLPGQKLIELSREKGIVGSLNCLAPEVAINSVNLHLLVTPAPGMGSCKTISSNVVNLMQKSLTMKPCPFLVASNSRTNLELFARHHMLASPRCGKVVTFIKGFQERCFCSIVPSAHSCSAFESHVLQ